MSSDRRTGTGERFLALHRRRPQAAALDSHPRRIYNVKPLAGFYLLP
ncbi:hypothetical protein [Thermomonospora umbrina]|nr:hypothetical protein [Thermomonospora umbrina]